MKSIRLFFRKFELSPLTFALLLVAPGLLYPTPADAAETLDQSQTASQSPTTVFSSGQRAQISGSASRRSQAGIRPGPCSVEG